ncbi:hypothetical protein KR093_009645, partial [Drosophila rubida]
MRWLTSLVFVGLATLAVSQTSQIAVRRARFANPLIKLAVQPAIASEPAEGVAAVAPVASVAAPSILPYVGAPQYWGGYGAPNSWYGWNNPAPFWGGYRPRNWRSLGGPYWRPRLPRRPRPAVEATTEAAVEQSSAEVVDSVDTVAVPAVS